MNIYKIFVIIAIVVVLGVLLLYVVGDLFISEVTKEVVIQEREQVVVAGVGESAPYFELVDLENNKIKSSDFLGAPLVLTFWTTWNVAAADQIKIFDDYSGNDSRNLFKIVAISSQEDRSVVAGFVGRGGYDVQILLDEDGSSGEKYEARNLPATYFIDKEGILRDVFVGILSERMLLDRVEQLLR